MGGDFCGIARKLDVELEVELGVIVLVCATGIYISLCYGH